MLSSENVHCVTRRECRNGGKSTVDQSSQCFDSRPRTGDLVEISGKLSEGVPDPSLQTFELSASIAPGIAVRKLPSGDRRAFGICTLTQVDQYIGKVVCQKTQRHSLPRANREALVAIKVHLA